MSWPLRSGERFLPSRLLAVFFHQRDGKRGFELGDVVELLQHGDVAIRIVQIVAVVARREHERMSICPPMNL